jgi:transglutaminase-like putative cysteine protease
MRIRVGYDIIYDCPTPTAMLLMLSIRPERFNDLVTPQVMTVSPGVDIREYLDDFGNLCTRLVAPAGPTRFQADCVVSDPGLPDPVHADAIQHPVDELPSDLLIFLLGSRYCETDRLSWIAWGLFGGIEPGWPRVQAICDYVHDRITFGYEYARNTRTAWEGHEERVGVCRDFAHLAVALCRCMNIPARYCTGYLGDIGVPVEGVMDFSAWFEVYLGGTWHTFDARHNTPRIGRIVMAHGRDATDTAISTTFGPNTLVRFDVIAEEVK